MDGNHFLRFLHSSSSGVKGHLKATRHPSWEVSVFIQLYFMACSAVSGKLMRRLLSSLKALQTLDCSTLHEHHTNHQFHHDGFQMPRVSKWSERGWTGCTTSSDSQREVQAQAKSWFPVNFLCTFERGLVMLFHLRGSLDDSCPPVLLWLASVVYTSLHLDILNTPCCQTVCARFHEQNEAEVQAASLKDCFSLARAALIHLLSTCFTQNRLNTWLF